MTNQNTPADTREKVARIILAWFHPPTIEAFDCADAILSAISKVSAPGSSAQELPPAADVRLDPTAYAEWLFRQPVRRLSVPCRINGAQVIAVHLADGSSVRVSAATVEEAWAELKAVAETMLAASPPPPKADQ